MKRGYARISTNLQELHLQIQALTKAGCDIIYQDTMSGKLHSRPELDRLLRDAQKGDSIVVWRLDRLGRSLPHLLELVDGFKKRGLHFESLNERIDTSSAVGELIFHVFASLAQFERRLIGERTKAGMSAKKALGVKFGPGYKEGDVCRVTKWRRAKMGIDMNSVRKRKKNETQTQNPM